MTRDLRAGLLAHRDDDDAKLPEDNDGDDDDREARETPQAAKLDTEALEAAEEEGGKQRPEGRLQPSCVRKRERGRKGSGGAEYVFTHIQKICTSSFYWAKYK